MIKHLSLKNFQGHKESFLTFGPGVNIVTGNSNAGKSTIVRALLWVVRNRPSNAGDAWKHWDADKEPVAVGLRTTENYSVVRGKGKGTVGYTMEEPDKKQTDFNAVKTGVPEEISSVINIGDHSIQTQHPPYAYFLIANSPAEVATKMNEVCGLDIIDRCLSAAAGLLGRTRQSIAARNLRIQELDASMVEYQGLDDRDKAVQLVEDAATQLRNSTAGLTWLDTEIKSVNGLQKELAELDAFLDVERAAAPLFAQTKELAVLQEDVAELERLTRNGRYQERELRRIDAEVAAMEKEFHKQLDGCGICPLCSSELTVEEVQ